MKTIKIFLASSEELDYDRMVFGNLIRRLDDVYEKRGLRIKLFEWEDYDAAFNDRRKQDEYNDYVKNSDIFLALFHKKAGKFTIEEFNVASAEFKEKASPKVYTFLRDLKPGEEESPELAEFKKRLLDEMGHYWSRYDNRDSLQLQFVMQLQLVESSLADSVKVENGDVNIDGLKVASMDHLQFAAANEDYIKMSEELSALPAKIEKARLRLEKFPDDEDLADDLQLKLNKYNKLKEEFAEYQKLLFNTAKRVAQLHGERVTERMRRAMDAFNEGKVREANIILDEAEADARRNLKDYKQSKEITELKRQSVISSIDELLLKTSTVMADVSIPIEERVGLTDMLFAQIDEMALAVEYDVIKFAQKLYDHSVSLFDGVQYNKARYYCEQALQRVIDLLGENNELVANCYDVIGHSIMRDPEMEEVKALALENSNKALAIRKTLLGDYHPLTADSYYSVGLCYEMGGDYSNAIQNYQLSLNIRSMVLGNNNPDTAQCYHEMGYGYYQLKEYSKAQDCYQKAAEIRERVLGETHLYTSFTYTGLGDVYARLSDFPNALMYYEKALRIQGNTSDDIFLAMSHETIADLYVKMGVFDDALKHYKEALMSARRFWEDDEEESIVELQGKINETLQAMN